MSAKRRRVGLRLAGLLIALLGGFRATAWALPVGGPASAGAESDLNLADYSREPFSDEASHGVLWRRKGLLAWRLSSARAFGSLAAAPNGAKLLFDLGLTVQVDGEMRPRFVSATAVVKDWPLWVVETAADSGLSAEAVTQFAGPDALVVALDLRNTGRKPLRLRPQLHMARGGQGLEGSVEASGRYPAVWMSLDRSQAVGRDLVEYAGVWMGGGPCQALLGSAPLVPRLKTALGGQGLDLALRWSRFQVLRPGKALRLPVLLVWGDDLPAVQKAAELQWRTSALPKGAALMRAKNRWNAQMARFPRLAAHERLLRRAVRALLLSDYGRQGALEADQFSAEKGVRDAFFSVDTPLAALGWAELDSSKAEAALLDLASFSADAPAAVPPYTGDEKLAWDAAGLPLNGLAAWELYQRDPQAPRAARFLEAFGRCLRHECAWWPPNRDGDGNGLYAFADADELPSYLQSDASSSAPVQPQIEDWSLSLTSLVAWQMQLAAVLAQSAGDSAESAQFLALAKHSQEAMHAQAWDLTQNANVQGLDGIWPFYLGLEWDETRAKQELQSCLLDPLAKNQQPWLQNGAWEPWRVYFSARTLAEFGYLKESKQISDNFLNKMETISSFPSRIKADGSYESGDSAATSAVVIEFLLEREQQNIFLTQDTGEFSSHFIQFRTLDGSFYMKRTKLPLKISKYSLIKIETPHHGKILEEGAMIFSSPDSMVVQFQSVRGLNISRAATPGRMLFKDAHNLELLVPARQRTLVQFVPESK